MEGSAMAVGLGWGCGFQVGVATEVPAEKGNVSGNEGGGATQACGGAQSRPSPSHICKSLLSLLLLSHL